MVRALSIMMAAVILAAICLPAFAQAPSRPAANEGPLKMSPTQRESLKKLTALFIITLALILIMVVALVVVGITIRRRLTAVESRQSAAATQLEDIWWRMEGPGASLFDDEKKE